MTESVHQQAKNLAATHYENFPVAPFFLPKKLRTPIALIYAFARTADDIADEGDLSAQQRQQLLDDMHQQLPDRHPKTLTPFFEQLNAMIEQHHLPVPLFHDLLLAFSQDLYQKTYETFEELLGYCQKSANPIGRLLLHLTHQATEQNLLESDCICSGLQIINFLQDLGDDLKQRQRLYIPLEDLKTFNLSQEELFHQRSSLALNRCLEAQWERVYQMMQKGKPLGKRLKGRFGFEIRLTVQGGLALLHKIKKRSSPYDRPTLKAYDWPMMVLRALF